MSAAITGKLSVDEGVVVFTEPVGVGEGEFEHFVAMMKRRINFFEFTLIGDEVEESALRHHFFSVKDDHEPCVEIGIETQATINMVVTKFKDFENFRIRRKADKGSVLFLLGGSFILRLENALCEAGLHEFSTAMRSSDKVARKRVDRLGADSVQADAELENIIVVFGTGVDT